MKKFIGIVTLGSLVFVSCENQKNTNKFSDPVLVKIADLQDHRSTDSLYHYFSDENPVHRRDAALAFASVQDTLAIEKLGDLLLTDKSPEVRIAAAVALGQIQTKKSAKILRGVLATEKDPAVLREVIESCGKTFAKEDIAEIEMSSSDTLVQEAMAWACYRLGLRGLADSTLNQKVADFLAVDKTLSTRVGAANFFARGAQKYDAFEANLVESATNDKSAWVRAGTTSSLRKIKTPTSLAVIKKILDTDKDYRVRVSAVRALQPFPMPDIKSNLFSALADANVNVAIAASEVMMSVATKEEQQEIVALAKKAIHWRVRGNLFEAALKNSGNNEIANEIITLYAQEKNPYGKAALLTALGESVTSWKFIDEQLHQPGLPVIKSSAAGALVSINTNKTFDKSLQKEYAEVYKKAFQTGDAAVIGTIASALMDSTLGYKKIITDFSFLYDAKNKLSLPKDNEALQPLEAAIAYFEGKKKSEPVKNEFNHPINWELVKTIPANQKVLIKTSKGEIVLQLLVEEAPGSVANFVQLVKDKYFDAKNFHRVVPNFVIQGGCNRGDGWGSEDYSIRSEFTERHYTEGSTGMASAGKDTEGTQWFITHSPTPHLDGKYSIFAVTLSGIDVVHQIEVGDNILSVELVK